MNLVDLIAKAIATMEGFFKAGSLAARNNNPGNLRSWGANPIVNGYAQFKSAEEGWAALKAQVQKNINRGLTLTEFFAGKPGVYAGYAPSADKNDPANYARFVAGRVGVDVSTPLQSIQQSVATTAQASPVPGFPPARGQRSQTSSSKPKGTTKRPSPPPSSARSR
jgi:hypothetical protein